MRPPRRLVLLATLALPLLARPAHAAADLWARDNLAAWCIVPYDAAKRGPEARAAMLTGLGVRKLAYDWRAEHVATFDAEVLAMKSARIEIVAWWFPTTLDQNARTILSVIARHGIRPQLWVTGGGAPVKDAAEQEKRVAAEVARLTPIVASAANLGCKVGLYNHGGWFGEPENQLAVLEKLLAGGATNVGLVYNFHHGHDHLDRFAEFWPRIQRHVLAVNVNGMVAGGDKAGKKLLYVGRGDRELGLMRIIDASGWRGLVGVLNHQADVDAETGLRENLAGLEKLAARLRAER